MDGVNPYSLQNTNYSFRSVVVINNNTPPWFSVNNEHLILALIVSGRRQVYLQPLVDELKELWDVINVYDVSRPIVVERSFTLYGIFSYMTHDYPGKGVCYGKLHVY